MSVVTGPDNQREEKISSLVRLYEKDLLRTCCVYLPGQGHGAGRRSGDVFEGVQGA